MVICRVYFSRGCASLLQKYIIYTFKKVSKTRWKQKTVPVGLCLMRKRKGLSTVTQGGEDRASKMAAKHKKHLSTLSTVIQNIGFVFSATLKSETRLTVQILTSGSCCFCSIFIHHNFGFLKCLGYMHRLSTWENSINSSFRDTRCVSLWIWMPLLPFINNLILISQWCPHDGCDGSLCVHV